MSGRWILVAVALQGGCVASEETDNDVAGFRLQEVSRFGSVEEEGSGLTEVASLALTDSTVLVLESAPPRVAVFSYDGRWLRDVGRAGDGPGEFRRPSRIGVWQDRIWVGDPRGGRLEVFGPGDAPLTSYRWDIPPDSLGARAFPTAQLSDGSILAGPGPLNIGAASRGSTTHRSYYRVTDAGDVERVLYRAVLEADDFFTAEVGAGQYIIGMHPIRASPIVALYPDGSGLVAIERPAPEQLEGAAFRIRVIRTDGSDELDLAVPYLPVSAEGWLERYLTGVEEDMIQRSGSAEPAVIEALREGMVDRRFYPPVTEARAGSDGSIWIRREETAQDSVAWQIFTRSGDLTGALSTPKQLDLIFTSLEEVWAVEVNEFDVPFLIRMRVVR